MFHQAVTVNHRMTRPVVIAILLAGLIRAAVVVLLGANLQLDPDAYRILAENLHHHGVFGLSAERPTAFRPPLYPLLLAPLAGGVGLSAGKVAVLHVVLGVATVFATATVARLWGLGPRRQLLAITLVAVDPILLYQSTFVMTETPATLLAVLVLWLLTRSAPTNGPTFQRIRRAMGSGAMLGIAMLCRPTFLLWLPGILLGFARAGGRVRDRFLGATVCLLALVLTLMPWTARNAWLLGKPIYSTTHGGYTLWLANNPWLYEYWRTGPHEQVWEAARIDAEQARIFQEVQRDEVAADQVAYARAWSTIQNDPRMFLYGCLYRLGQLWQPLPNRLLVPEPPRHLIARWVIAAWYVGLYALAVLGAWRIGRKWTVPPWIWGLGLLAAITLAHTFYWSNVRMRAPMIPVIAIVAAAGVGRFDPGQTVMPRNADGQGNRKP